MSTTEQTQLENTTYEDLLVELDSIRASINTLVLEVDKVSLVGPNSSNSKIHSSLTAFVKRLIVERDNLNEKPLSYVVSTMKGVGDQADVVRRITENKNDTLAVWRMREVYPPYVNFLVKMHKMGFLKTVPFAKKVAADKGEEFVDANPLDLYSQKLDAVVKKFDERAAKARK